jgi:hypothetical protein
VIAAIAFAGSYYAAQSIAAKRLVQPADELAWLRGEFQLNDVEMARIQELHNGYLPRCMEMCALIAAKKGEVEQALSSATNITDDARQKLGELGALRAQCQAQMLEHFLEVSRAMPHAQGERYLAEMRRLTLGSHEQVEQSMSNPAGGHHGHH